MPHELDPNESPLGYLMRLAAERDKKCSRKVFILGMFQKSKSGFMGSITLYLN